MKVRLPDGIFFREVSLQYCAMQPGALSLLCWHAVSESEILILVCGGTRSVQMVIYCCFQVVGAHWEQGDRAHP